MLVHSPRMRQAIDFAVDAHQVQVRKGKDVPYIVHPLTVAMILSSVGADEDLVIAGLLHDTVEDSRPPNAISPDSVRETFGDAVACLVESVTEHDKSLSWDERKEIALAKIPSYTQDFLLLKSADVVANDQELIADFKTDGSNVFARFNSDAAKILTYKRQLIEALLDAWPKNPLAVDLRSIRCALEQIAESFEPSAGVT